MANRFALVLIAGTLNQIHQPDVLVTGAGITSDTVALSISSATANINPDGTKNWVPSAGVGNVDLSSMTGTFHTPTGAVTLGPGAISVTGNMTMQAGTLLATTGTGNIDLPNNAASKFQIEGVAVSANVTAANLGTLTAGPASNADALHTHAGLSATSLHDLVSTAAMGASGTAGYISGVAAVSPTDNTAIGTARFYGIFVGTAGQVQVAGSVASVEFTTVGGAPANGAPVYLAAAADDGGTGAGKLTATPPIAGVIAQVGICKDNTNYVGLKTASVLIQPVPPIIQ